MKRGLSCLLCAALAVCILQGCKSWTGAKTHEKLTDRAIAAEIRAKILEAGLPPIRVFVLEGRVTLSGIVPKEEAKERVIALAKSVRGVASVSEDLAIEKLR
jgi:osmotically-inducible protein OsmY